MTPAAVTVTPHPVLDWTLTVPGLALGATHESSGYRVEVGGGGIDVALRLAEVGVAVAATGYLGDANADPFEALLERGGVADRFVRVEGPTRVLIHLVDPEGETTVIHTPGAPPSLADRARLADVVGELASTRPIVVLAGTLPAGLAPAAYREVVGTLRDQGCRVVLDTSGDALAVALDASDGMLPHVVTPTADDLAAVAGRPLPDRPALVGAAREVVERGADLVVVSQSGEGPLFVTRDLAVEAVSPAVDVQREGGAQAALVAGVVAAGLMGMDLRATARHAAAVALRAIAVERASVSEWESRVEIREAGSS